jgi:membrane-bound lytic murein transglycosylase F
MDFLFTLLIGFFANFWGSSDTLLSQIRASGELVIATRNDPLSYYQSAHGHTGFEYDLAKAFADELGLELRVVVAENSTDILRLVANNRVHFAVGAMMQRGHADKNVRFGPAYYAVRSQIAGRKDGRIYRTLAALSDSPHCLVAVAASPYAQMLAKLSSAYPYLDWRLTQQLDALELLEQVHHGLSDYALVGSHELQYAQRYYPELRALFDIDETHALTWAFPRLGGNDGLYLAAIQFFQRIRRNGDMAGMLARYYSHGEDFDYVNTREFHRHIDERLGAYEAAFKVVAADHDLDWRLLAALAYQESRWNPQAVSPTGVRGLMMLTAATAEDMGVADRHDPWQSIVGGAKYLAKLKHALAPEISEPDRTWMALAAYNLGPGHVRDAQTLVAQKQGDPQRWLEVEKYIVRLSQRQWYTQTRHGYARGFETVRFLKRIREYYAILRKWDEENNATLVAPPLPPKIDSPVL